MATKETTLYPKSVASMASQQMLNEFYKKSIFSQLTYDDYKASIAAGAQALADAIDKDVLNAMMAEDYAFEILAEYVAQGDNYETAFDKLQEKHEALGALVECSKALNDANVLAQNRYIQIRRPEALVSLDWT